MPKKRAHSFEELMKPLMESQQSKIDTTDEEVLEQKPDRDAIEKWASDLAFKIEEIHEDVRDLERDLAYVISQVDDLQSEDR
jgi:arsenate reductase-like glutaredoxin family protein